MVLSLLGSHLFPVEVHFVFNLQTAEKVLRNEVLAEHFSCFVDELVLLHLHCFVLLPHLVVFLSGHDLIKA